MISKFDGRMNVLQEKMDAHAAGTLEERLVAQRMSEGISVNLVKGGFTGRGILIYTFDTCIRSASRFDAPILWKNSDPGAYCAALKRGWKDLCTDHMAGLRRTWEISKDEALTSMSKYNSRSEFKRGDARCYRVSKNLGWMDGPFVKRAFPGKSGLKHD